MDKSGVDEILTKTILQFEITKLERCDKHVLEEQTDESEGEEVEGQPSVNIGVQFSESPLETFYSVALKPRDVRLIDLSKLRSPSNDCSELPFLKVTYEHQVDDILESQVTHDEIFNWYDAGPGET